MWRTFHYNNKSLKNRRKQLRNQCTESEKLLWIRLKKSQLGQKFIRQYSIDGYVTDFYCPHLRIAIEVDGGIHYNKDQVVYDKYRNRIFQAHDILVIRIKNHDVINKMDEVISRIASNFPS